MSKSSSISVSLPPIELSKLHDPAVREVDFVGYGTKTVSQINLLHRRSVEISNSKEADLSARGLHHRSREYFVAQVKQHSAVIKQYLRSSQNAGMKHGQSVLPSYFGRAFAYERLGNLDRAMADYTTCILIQKTHAPSYFNRANVFVMKENYEAALVDLDEAIKLDRGNATYRTERALLLRKLDRYLDATSDVLMCRTMDALPDAKSQTADVNSRPASARRVSAQQLSDDPVIVALQKDRQERTDTDQQHICRFICNIRFFSGIAHDESVVNDIATRLRIESCQKDQLIFDEGDIADKFYVIFDGEVSIVKKSVQHGELTRAELARLYRGGVFGESALQSRGKRSAGILATQPCLLVTLDADDFLNVMDKYLQILREEVRQVLSLCSVFHGWEPSKLVQLSRAAVLKTFESNCEIVHLGEVLDSFYIVKQGVINVIRPTKRSLCVSHPRQAHGNHTAESAGWPGNWVLNRSWKDRSDTLNAPTEGNTEHVNFVVGVLGSGQFFGELAILDPERGSPSIVKTCTTVEVYCIPSSVMFELGAQFQPATMAALNEAMNLHSTPEDKLACYFRNRLSWEQKKCKLLTQLLNKC